MGGMLGSYRVSGGPMGWDAGDPKGRDAGYPIGTLVVLWGGMAKALMSRKPLRVGVGGDQRRPFSPHTCPAGRGFAQPCPTLKPFPTADTGSCAHRGAAPRGVKAELRAALHPKLQGAKQRAARFPPIVGNTPGQLSPSSPPCHCPIYGDTEGL